MDSGNIIGLYTKRQKRAKKLVEKSRADKRVRQERIRRTREVRRRLY